MAIIGDALRQAFMPKHEYEILRDEEKAWGRIQKPLVTATAVLISIAVVISISMSMTVVFPGDPGRRPFCKDRSGRQVGTIPANARRDSEAFRYRGAFYLTDEEAADYYWMVVLVPSTIVFAASVVYLVAGMAVAYSAPTRHMCLGAVENNYCASKRGGVRCLSILNIIFAAIFGLLALFLGSSLLTLGSDCSIPLFWCYEVASWGLVTLYGGTAFFLKRKAAIILDDGEFGSRNLGLEMSEPSDRITPDMERRVNEGFKAWMGSSLLSSDEDDEDIDGFLEETHHPILHNSLQQRV